MSKLRAALSNGLARLAELSRPPLDREYAITEDSMFRRFALQPYSPDKLVTRKGFKIYDQMVNDDQIAQSLTALKLMRLSGDWKIKPASDKPAHRDQADFVEWILTEFLEGSFHDDLWEIMGALEMGYSVSELVWSKVERGRYAGKIGLKAVKNKRPYEFNIDVDDFDNIKPDGVVKITYPNYAERFPADKFVIYSFRKRYEGVFGTSILRSLYDLYWIKHVTKRAMGIYIERLGVPLAVGKYPSTFKQGEQDALLTMIKQIRLESAATIPKDVELLFQETQGRGTGHKLFLDIITHVNEQITKTMLGQTLTSGTQGVGSQALGRVHKDILTLYLDEVGYDVATKAVNPQIIRRLIDYNFADVEEYPTFEFGEIAQQDEMPLVDKFLAAVKEKVVIPTKEDEAKIREILQFPERNEDSEAIEPIKKEPEEGAPMPPPPPAPGVPPQPDLAPNNTPTPPGTTPTAKEPGLPGASSQAPEAPPENSPAKMGECRHYAEQLFTGVPKRAFTQAEKRVDFQEAKAIIEETGVDDLTADLTPILQEAVAKIQRDLLRKKIIERKDFAALNKLQVSGVGEMRRVIADNFTRVIRRGMKSARQELTKARKEAKLQEPQDIRQLKPEQVAKLFGQRAFDMAGTISETIKAKAKQVISQGIKNGQGYKEVSSALQDTLEPFVARGAVDPAAASGPRLDTMARTNIVDAFNTARREEFRKDADFVPFLQYSAILDDRVRPNHAKMDGNTYRTSSPVWDAWTPPNGYNCRCLLVALTLLDDVKNESAPPSVSPDKGFGAAGA